MKAWLRYAMGIIAIGCAASASAELKSVSAEDFSQIGQQEAYWVFTATCDDDSEHQVRRRTDGDEWCATDVEGYCDTDKQKAAALVCSDKYLAEVSAVVAASEDQRRDEEARREAQRERERREANERAARARAAEQEEARRKAAEAEQLSIEEELLSIEQEKLELRKRELDLQRRTTEIQSLLEDTGS